MFGKLVPRPNSVKTHGLQHRCVAGPIARHGAATWNAFKIKTVRISFTQGKPPRVGHHGGVVRAEGWLWHVRRKAPALGLGA
jgi:hypothetical protein